MIVDKEKYLFDIGILREIQNELSNILSFKVKTKNSK